MCFRLTLELTNTRENTIPLNYQYELSSWIYKVIHLWNPEFFRWLHEQGYLNDRKQFRFFTFSNLIIPERSVKGDRLTAPPELLRLGYYTGYGEKNSMGFGCGEVK